jgi:NitT/TauT family transport system substrate-binding protein
MSAFCRFCIIAVTLAAFEPLAYAEVPQINVAQEHGVGFLPLMIMERDGLVEKNAAADGVPVKVNWVKVAGPGVINDGIISGAVQFAAQGIVSMITLWDRTRSTVGVKALAAVGAWPLYLISRNPELRSVRDISSKDKIAVPSAKISLQAIILQMAAAKEFSIDQYAKFDVSTLSMAHPDALLALASNTAGVNGHFSASPFYEREIAMPGVHLVATSWDIVGGPQTSVVMTSTSKFRNENPKLTKAFFNALAEAVDTVNRDRRSAAQYYLTATNDKGQTVDDIVATMEKTRYTTKPQNIMVTANFLAKVGLIKTTPSNIDELFFPEAGSVSDQ